MFTFRYKNRHFLRYYFESQNPTFRRTGRILSGKAAGMIPTATGRIGKPLLGMQEMEHTRDLTLRAVILAAYFD